VREAVVVVSEEEGGEKRLVSYVVWEKAGGGAGEGGGAARGGGGGRKQALKKKMRERLPEYMIPGIVIEMEEMPKQPNGKVDRKRLMEIAERGEEEEGEKEGARTPVEEILVEIWREVLGVESIGVDDNFFDLGGHSLMTIKIISRIRRAFKVELPIRNMFERATVASQAAQIESVYRAGQEDRTPKLRPVPRDSTLALSYAQQRLWLIDQLESATVGYNIPAAVRLTGQLDVSALEHSLNELASRHETLRTTFASTGGQPVQIIAPVLNLKISVSDLQELPAAEREAELRRLLIEGAQESLDLAQGPLIRAALFRLSPDEHVFLIVMHHIVSDGWSMSILINELATLYEAFSKGQPSPLSPLPIQYADFAQWQREWMQGEVLASQLAYWKKQLGGDLPVLKLATDRPRTAVQTFRGATQHRVLDESLSGALKKLGRREGATLFMTLLTVFKILLHRYTGQEEIIVGTNVASRNWLDTEGLIGFFVNELVLRTPLSGNPTFKELLGRVREVTLGAYAHQDVPFDKLVYALMPERNLSRAPLFQVLVDLQSNPLPSLKLTGLTISPVDINFGAAYFDLTLLMVDADERLTTALHYKTDLFESATITRMLESFERLLRLVVAEPDARLKELLSMLADAEKQQRLIKQRESKAANLQDLKKLRRRAIDG
jgi:acyl carrier protein